MKSPVLLCYHLHGELGSKIKLVAMRFAIRIRVVQPEAFGQPLAALCGLEAEQPMPAPADTFEESMLIMAFFPDGLVQDFLMALRRAKIPPVRLKAVLTETNRMWNSVEMYRQISKEADAFEQRQQASRVPAQD